MSNPIDSVQSLITNLGKGVFWVVILRGVLAILFGIFILVAPAAVAFALGIYIGAWLIVDGILTIINANTARRSNLPWGWELTSGIVYILAGLIIAIAPMSFALITGVFILWMLAFGMLIRGIFSLASKSFQGWSKLLGVLDIIFAVIVIVVVFSNPGAALAALIWIVAVYTIVFGAFLIIMAFMARSQAKKATTV
ncbi:MAG: HdeD family acid-resistance protein [Brevibacterium sp.]